MTAVTTETTGHNAEDKREERRRVKGKGGAEIG